MTDSSLSLLVRLLIYSFEMAPHLERLWTSRFFGTSSPEGVKVSCSIELMGEKTADLKNFQERRGKAIAQPREISSLIFSLIHSTCSSRILFPFLIARLKSSAIMSSERS